MSELSAVLRHTIEAANESFTAGLREGKKQAKAERHRVEDE